MTDFTKYVDVFLGCDSIDLPKPEGIAAEWRFIKGLCGNNHPGAVLPFGRMSCCCYSGAYSAGYGRNMPNFGGPIKHLFAENMFAGLSHFHHSGTGYIGVFYNYALTSPFYGALSAAFELRPIDAEEAIPGYYSVKSGGIHAAATVTKACALHRYSFSAEGGRIAIDFSNDGLDRRTKAFSRPTSGVITRISEREVCAEVTLQGVKLYFYVVCGGAARSTLFCGESEMSDSSYDASAHVDELFGCVFDLSGTSAELTLCISAHSMERARSHAHADHGRFDEASLQAREMWNAALSKIRLGGDDEELKPKFYSYLYHTLLKPCDWTGERLFGCEGEFYCDLCTMWDIYKTQLPLVFTLFPDVTRGIMETFHKLSERTGRLPHALLLAADRDIEIKQARALAEFSIADAYFRRAGSPDGTVRGVPTAALLDAAERDIYRPEYSDFTSGGRVESATQHLDMCEACRAIAQVAAECGRTELVHRLMSLYERWPEVYDADGLMRSDSWYYEGTRVNYSFRLAAEPEKRIALAGGRERYLKHCDRFFGFAPSGDKFEGFNNETDMETPYIYHFAGRRDRMAEVLHTGNKYMFSVGRGGVPGNNDSGGLTSCWIWNALGLFPVSGQDKMIIGSPLVKYAEMELASGAMLAIKVTGSGIYTKSATLNGRRLDDFELRASELMAGGVLEIKMCDTPVQA
jgi:putative alpha-1,2-mannosidase